MTTSNASYDDTVITTGTSTYDFTIYEKFSSAELDHFGIPRLRLPGGNRMDRKQHVVPTVRVLPQ